MVWIEIAQGPYREKDLARGYKPNTLFQSVCDVCTCVCAHTRTHAWIHSSQVRL